MRLAKRREDIKNIPSSEKAKINQSTYCDYNEAFLDYDKIRQPHGLGNILEILRHSEIPLSEQIILEGGFGTGAYLHEIRHHVHTINGIEGSDEGYRRTLQKVGSAANVKLHLGDILHLAFPDKSFDAYMANQVVHHFDNKNNFQSIDVFLKEAYRVLKPGGHLIINTCSKEQLDPAAGSYWHYKYIYSAALSILKYYIAIEELELRLESLGFTEIKCAIPQEKIFNRRYYEDPTFVLEPEFMKGDSTYSFLSEVELEASYHQLREAIEEGIVYEVMDRAAVRASEIGEGVIISARKQ